MKRLLVSLFSLVLLLSGCGGGGGDAGSFSNGGNSGSTTSNSVAMIVDSGPVGATGQLNLPYVTVNVCVPGTNTCTAIDHVLVDTGSSGLRVLASALQNALPTQSVGSRQVMECAQFADGFTWGTVSAADVKIAGKTASALPIQVIADGALPYPVPAACSSTGSNESSLAALGAKGIVGVGLSSKDCSNCAVVSSNGLYYLCSGQTCQQGAVPLAQEVTNPVTAFSGDNNGVLLQLPSIDNYGAPSAQGTLTFGIATQSNNAIPGSAKAYPVSSDGFTITTVYNGQSYPGFLDSGSNILYFPNDGSVATCSVGGSTWYCPNVSSPQAQSLNAQVSASNGSSSTINFNLINASILNSSNYAAFPSLAAPMTGTFAGYFDWGLPFFYGRSVFIGFAGSSNPQGSGAMYVF